MKDKVEYAIFGKEVGENGTPHIQGFCHFKTEKSLKQMKDLWPRAHFEIARGKDHHNQTYCKKEGCFLEFGTPCEQGKRNDLIEMKKIIDEGGDEMKLREHNYGAWIRYQRAFINDMHLTAKDKEPERKKSVFWFWGKSGTGKSYQAFQGCINPYFKSSGKWWDGYIPGQEVIIDDFDPKDYAFRDLLRLLDNYPLNVEVKGGMTKFTSKIIYITCEFHPCQIWEEENTLKQVERRITEIRQFHPHDNPEYT